MPLRNASAPATAGTATRGRKIERCERLYFPNSTRSARRQRLVAHLHRCGPRPVFEALLLIEAGRPVDEVLEAFARLPPEIYLALGADELPVDQLTIIDGYGS